MKKLVVLFFALCVFQVSLHADNDKVIQSSQLPQQAQQFIKKHFSKNSIALTKLDDGFFKKSYEVLFTDGSKVEFLNDGTWEEIDCKYSSVPNSLVPTAINNYVAKNYQGVQILKIERSNRGDYEIKLSNRLELTFNSDYNLIDIDD